LLGVPRKRRGAIEEEATAMARIKGISALSPAEFARIVHAAEQWAALWEKERSANDSELEKALKVARLILEQN
jgi:DNA-binding transcriptional regulator YiaG